jgi:hypothetical protein
MATIDLRGRSKVPGSTRGEFRPRPRSAVARDLTPADPPVARPKRVFAFEFEPLLAPFAAALGVRNTSAWVELDPGFDLDGKDDEVQVHFGPWSMAFPRYDVVDAEVTGPSSLLQVVGPPRLSLRDRGVTFATTRSQGLRISLRAPRKAIDPFGLLLHHTVTVTVADPVGLRDALFEATDAPEGQVNANPV